MLTVTRTDYDRLDVDLSGKLDSVDMATGLDHLIAEAADMKHAKMLYRIKDMEMPSLSALAVEFGHLPSLFGLLGKFDRCAVLASEPWLRTLAEFEGAILPGLQIKAFPPDAEKRAIAWLDAQADDPFDDVPV